MRIREYCLKVFPYLASIAAGLLFYFIGLNLQDALRSLFTSISAAFFAIPLIYLFYQLTQNLAKRRLNKEIYDYVKMQVDREVLSIVNQLQKIVYPFDEQDFSEKGVNHFLSLTKDGIGEVLSKNKYLGFQVFKEWSVIEENLHNILRNAFVITRLNDDRIISIIRILKGLRHIEAIQKGESIYYSTTELDTSYKVIPGRELHPDNIRFPNRHLLLRDVGGDKAQVIDFGDFRQYNQDKLLEVFTVNESNLTEYASAIYYLMKQINDWTRLTNREFVIDTKMFRIGVRVGN
jgi:hypothetical protein